MKRFYTIKEYCAAFGCGRTKVYSEIAAGSLESVKDGARTLITAESAERRAASLPRFKSAAASARATEAA
jgi:excisionase family DNA binding protein